MEMVVCVLAFYLVLLVFVIATMWKVFEKAGGPGWAALVPFYNMYVMTTVVAGKEALWFWLQFVPFVNIYVGIMECLAVAERFGKSPAFGVGLMFLPFIFFPILAFGDAEHDSQLRRGRRRLRSRDRDYGDYDDDDRPAKRKRKRRDEYDDEDDEDDRPAKKRRPIVDEDDDRPAPRRRRRDDDD